MAVVQISKIQIRRGLKNSGIGVPQLSSAEMAWAIDSQELYIGNGSIAEGAPYVGNTKILTENDNLLSLASSYTFGYTDPSINLSLPRSIQSKLDEIQVSVADYGAVGDGSTDCVEAFTNAVTELFRNTNPDYKKVLLVPNGEYLFLSDLKIPSGTIVRGETKLNTVLLINDNNILFVTSEGLEVADFNSSNRPVNIEISNLTIQRQNGETVFTGVADSKIENVRFVGEYSLGNTIGSLITQASAVFWENSLAGTRTTGLKFINCEFDSNAVAVRCDNYVVDSTSPPVFRTDILFDSCTFAAVDTAVLVTTDALLISQGNDWQFNDCLFEEVANRAIYTTGPGRGTLVNRCTFKNCGNGVGSAGNPTVEIIAFGDQLGNVVTDCSFNRHQNASVVSLNTTKAVSEVVNAANVSIVDKNSSDIYLSDSLRTLAVFSAHNKFTTINYTLRLSSHVRHGQITITIDDDYSSASLSDNYQYSASTITAPGGALMTNFEFAVELRDNDADSGVETLVLYYKNPLATGATGTISYSVAYGV
jgi:hypothetical protein